MNIDIKALDAQIGLRIRKRRKILRIQAMEFASSLGVSVQQLNKYENGINRVSSSQLSKISKLLSVEIDYFVRSDTNPTSGFNFSPSLSDSFRAGEIINSVETANLVKSYIAINDVRTRLAIVELVTSITKYLTRKAS